MYYLGHDWPNGALQYTQAHYCKSASEQTWTSVKVQCTPTVQVASVVFCTKKSKVYIIMSYSFFFSEPNLTASNQKGLLAWQVSFFYYSVHLGQEPGVNEYLYWVKFVEDVFSAALKGNTKLC